MAVNLYSQSLQPALISGGAGLSGILGQTYAAHVQAVVAESVDQPEHIHIIGDSQVGAHLAFLNIRRIDDDNDLRLIFQLYQHVDLAVRLESGQHPGGVIVVEEFAAKFQIQLAAETLDALFDFLGLHFQVFIIVKTGFFHVSLRKKQISFTIIQKTGSKINVFLI